ncbi:magnesium transporter CorA family protein [Neolewinella aurantiaca]|uniref:Magnesium transporter CorA family protein n=1 Tax=Neolewinella aurantiaca TaxID=2602767 RepID=A0A5C7FP12_9BACT|nr:magnesium transporter CorA family protein [Neolewinella aurantiaca]TXF88145.1 magnesium transporter CorA family protein [Neolewinella aurantiaca]
MISYYASRNGRLEEMDSLVEEGCWISLTPPFEADELARVANDFDLPPDFLTDPLDTDERSRYEREDDARLIVLNTPLLSAGDGDNDGIYITAPIGLILVEDHLITVTSSASHPVLKLFTENKVRNVDTARRQHFVLRIFEQTVYRYLTCLKRLNVKRNMIEQELYESSQNKELKQLLSIEKSLVYFINALNGNELLKMKMKRTDFLAIRHDEDLADLFEDIIIDNGQALEMANIYTNILNGTMSAFGSIISNNLNITIQRLTLITIILTVPMVIASFFGMNVTVPYQSGSVWAFFGIILISVLMSVAVIAYFRRKRMF